MKRVASRIYRISVPKFIRKRIKARRLKRSILNFYECNPNAVTTEIGEILDYLKTNPISVFPYKFQDDYDPERIEVLFDQAKGLKYVMQDGKRLYFKKRWSSRRIRHSFNELSKEQDHRSPHRYLMDGFKVEYGEIFVDIGVAEGNFALSIVDIASKLILFETDSEWIEALHATFEPWKDKVLIVNKFVSNTTSLTDTRLDDFMEEREDVTFLKIDVDGAESKLLEGCSRILAGAKPLKLAVCTYHQQNDEQDFTKLLNDYGFQTTASDGYMLFHYHRGMEAPYFRRGLLRAVK